jgi:glycosyltransferase involved in cell wall biosynthesis
MTFGDFRDKTTIIPAFIPPTWRSEDEANVSEEIRHFCAEHSPVILAMGGPVLRGDGTDLYGIDMTIDLVDRLRSSLPKVGVLWSLIDVLGSDPIYADRMRARLMQRSLEGHWLFSGPQETFHPIYRLADILVRPTVTDGDALSVREALESGVPTVASDAAPRPEGTTIFPSRNQAAFERAVRKTLENLDTERQRIQNLPSDTAVDVEIALLKEVIAEADACERTSV